MYFRNKVKAFCRNSPPAYSFNISNFYYTNCSLPDTCKKRKGFNIASCSTCANLFEQYSSTRGPMPNPIQNDGGPAVRKRRLTTHCSQMQ